MWNFLVLAFFVISKVAAGSEKVVTMLPNNAIVEAVYKVDFFLTFHRKMRTNIKYILQEVLDNARSGSLLVDCSTVSKQHSEMQCAQPILPVHNDDDENGLVRQYSCQ